MKLIAVYLCEEVLVVSVEVKQKTGFITSTLTMFSISKYEEKSKIQELFDRALHLSNSDESGEKYSSAKFNKQLAKLCNCSSYKEVVSKSSIVKVVHKQDQVTLIPMQKSSSFLGYEGYNNYVETLPSDSLENEVAVRRVIELLEEVLNSYRSC